MSGIRVVRLGSEATAATRDLNALFADVFDDPGTYRSEPPSDAYLADLLGDPRCVALAAYDGERIVGGLAGYELRKFEQERSEFYIYDLAVVADARRRGVATALIEEFGRIARAAGGWVVFVQADHGDEPAIALYEKLGTREDVIHFDIAPDDQPKAG